MRYGIFSDIHSNLEALEAVIKAYKSEGIDIYLCLGDIVGYGANPVECIQITKDIAQIIIAEHAQADWQQVDSLSDTERAAGGFGSTGTK